MKKLLHIMCLGLCVSLYAAVLQPAFIRNAGGVLAKSAAVHAYVLSSIPSHRSPAPKSIEPFLPYIRGVAMGFGMCGLTIFYWNNIGSAFPLVSSLVKKTGLKITIPYVRNSLAFLTAGMIALNLPIISPLEVNSAIGNKRLNHAFATMLSISSLGFFCYNGTRILLPENASQAAKIGSFIYHGALSYSPWVVSCCWVAQKFMGQ